MSHKRSLRLAFQAHADDDEVQLQVRRVGGGVGHGLFPSSAIARGAPITSMEQPRAVESEMYATRMGYPHDSVVWLSRKKAYYDESFQRQPGYRPMWYRMNHAHASSANVELAISNDGTPIWFAKRSIDPGQELRWDYGDNVPEDWNRQ